jgi:glucose/arabinose dehydrogenase
MKFFFPVVLLALLAPASSLSAADPNTLSELERKLGWRLLFDGKTLDGWRNYRKQAPSNGWQVIDGELVRAKKRAGTLITKAQFGSFELVLEYKISRAGNSGIMFHATEEYDTAWKSGPEVQLLDNGAHPDTQLSGWIYDLYSAGQDATRPAGEWNEVRILVIPDQCHTSVNGVTYARFVKGSDQWNKKVARSKFARYPNFGKATRGHIGLQDHGDEVAFRNIKIREFDDHAVYNPVDGELPLRPVLAFPDIQWSGWSPVTEDGLAQPFRPLQITHAGDGSNRLFVLTQRGVIHVFENKQDVKQSRVFLDIGKLSSYFDRQNERGLLGLAFHPRYRENGEFFISYTTNSDVPFDEVISRWRVDPNDPNRADPNSEEEILRVKQPYWNHNAGSLAFGPDGYLYIALGDGGSGGDPHENGQNLRTLLGKILRIDIDRTDGRRPYAIPSDNPFVDNPSARGEIWAYGLRNVWRMAFDPKTNLLWAADVGQDLFEEIDIIQRGGNYGWNLREAKHAYGRRGSGPHQKLIEPVWEYDHALGVSLTGGLVYRGKRLPDLVGLYVYGDYGSGRMWALHYDHQQHKVLGNYAIPGPSLPITSFGTDEAEEIFFTIIAADGQGIYRFEKVRQNNSRAD